MRPHLLPRLALLAAGAVLLAACGGDGDAGDAPHDRPPGLLPQRDPRPGLGRRRGGLLRRGPRRRRETRARPTSTPAPRPSRSLFAEALDATFIGPNPAINGYAQSNGEALRIIAGSTSGGAFLVVRPGIDVGADLVGTTLATPQLGNTQDVALRAWLVDQGLCLTPPAAGRVHRPQSNADTLNAFKAGDIDGAWVPEPWATRLIQEGGGKVLVDETRPVARRRLRHHPPDRAHRVPRASNPDVDKSLLPRPDRGGRASSTPTPRGPSPTNDGIEAITGARAARRRDRRRLGEPHLHLGPDRLLAAEIGRRRGGGRPARPGGPHRHL